MRKHNVRGRNVRGIWYGYNMKGKAQEPEVQFTKKVLNVAHIFWVMVSPTKRLQNPECKTFYAN